MNEPRKYIVEHRIILNGQHVRKIREADLSGHYENPGPAREQRWKCPVIFRYYDKLEDRQVLQPCPYWIAEDLDECKYCGVARRTEPDPQDGIREGFKEQNRQDGKTDRKGLRHKEHRQRRSDSRRGERTSYAIEADKIRKDRTMDPTRYELVDEQFHNQWNAEGEGLDQERRLEARLRPSSSSTQSFVSNTIIPSHGMPYLSYAQDYSVPFLPPLYGRQVHRRMDFMPPSRFYPKYHHH